MIATQPAGPNPLLQPSSLPYELPPFAEIEPRHFREAFDLGIAEKRAEIRAVLEAEVPTFENTLVALERSGALLERASRVFYLLTSAHTNPELQQIQSEYAATFAAFADEVMLDPALFARIQVLHAARDELELDAEERRLLDRYHLDFVRAGAGLSAVEQQQLSELNAELATATTTFGNHLLADTNDAAVLVTDPAELNGMSAEAIAAARTAAEARSLEGYLITLVLPTHQPALEVLRNRELRHTLWQASVRRGARGNEYDTSALVCRIAELRARRAQLLGYPTYSDYVLADRTAGTNEALDALLAQLVPAAVSNAKRECEELAAAMAADVGESDLQPWDLAYYAEQVKQQRFDVDPVALEPYFELTRTLEDGIFYAAGQLYGVRFEARPDLAGYHPDAVVYEVLDADGTGIGLFVGDYFSRDSKRGGAWMEAVVGQSTLRLQRPVVINNVNVPKPPPGRPALLSLNNVVSIFHEFGHALHGLFSQVRFPRLAGTAVARDFVEYPSQVNEMWLTWPDVVHRYARHHATGDVLDAGSFARLERARAFGQGWQTVAYLAATCIDLAWHRLGPGEFPSPQADGTDGADAVAEFERSALAAWGLDLPAVPARYLSRYFNHVFSGGYAAGYYSYIWSEVLDADTADWFTESGGLVRACGDRFRAELLSRGGTAPEMSYVRAVLGREPRIEPLLARRGLADVGESVG